MELVRYLHLNPVRSKLAKSAERYPYSGEPAYRAGKPNAIVDPRPVLALLGGTGRYRRFVQEGLGAGHREEYYEVEDQRFLGDGEFGAGLRREFEEQTAIKKKRSMTVVVREMARVLEITPELLRAPSRDRKLSGQRTLVAYVLVRRGGYSVKEVAAYFGRDTTTISSLISRYERDLPDRPEIGKILQRLVQFV